MKPADAFRSAASSFGGSDFTRTDFEARYYALVDGGRSDTHFSGYFSNFKRRSIGGLQIVPAPGGLFRAVITPALTRVARAHAPARRTSRAPKPVIKYPNPIPHYPVFHSFVSDNGLSAAGNIVLLTNANAAIVEGLIAHDPDYQPNALRLFESFCRRNAGGIPIHSTFDFTNPEHVLNVIQKINKDNSTFDIAITSKGRYPISACQTFCDYICDPTNSFLAELDGAPGVITNLVEKIRLSHTFYNAKSLASKVCKYFHEFYYDHDKFFINDKVVRSMLPYYLDYYGIPHTLHTCRSRDLLYPNLYDYLEQLRDAAFRTHGGTPLKRSELDHILWYCYKMFKNKEL